MDVCDGGTIKVGATSIPFTNNHTTSCTLSNCNMPGWPSTNPVVPAKSGSTPGSLTVQLGAAATQGDYSYNASCCSKRTNPTIKVESR